MYFAPLTRRGFLGGLAATGVAGSGWFPALARAAAAQPERRRSVILLWMAGGPATIDLWDLKVGHANGGPFEEIATASAGVRISEHLPKLAKQTERMAIIRSMTSKEGDHNRATHLGRTGYSPQGAILFPALGALVARELGREESLVPAFVSIMPGQNAAAVGCGFLGPRYAPLLLGDAGAGSDGLKVPNLDKPADVPAAAYDERLKLLHGLEKGFMARHGGEVVESLHASGARALRLMQPAAAAAFRLDSEKPATREAYGQTPFGQSCLLARRLVERDVPFVEVSLDGWDTHGNNFERVKALSQTLDTAYAALFTDLHERGLLDRTLVICMGEFGRTPKINNNTGRDHWPRAWSAVLSGGGIRGGQAIGKTSADGTTVEDPPTRVPDLMATICRAIGIDPRKQNESNVSRPIRIADPSGTAIEGVL